MNTWRLLQGSNKLAKTADAANQALPLKSFEHLLRGALQILGSSAMRKGAVAVTGATGE